MTSSKKEKMTPNEEKVEIRAKWERLQTRMHMIMGLVNGGHNQAASEAIEGMDDQLTEFGDHVADLTKSVEVKPGGKNAGANQTRGAKQGPNGKGSPSV